MKKKQLFILLAVGIALLLLYLWQQSSTRENWSGEAASTGGSTILPETFNSEEIQTAIFERDGQTATLQKGNQGWTMAERYNYPVDFANLKTLFVDLYETKVAQTLTLNENQAAELQLTPETGAVSLTLLDQEGKKLSKLIFGKKHERETEMPPSPYGGGGNAPIGRFLQINDRDFILAANTFSRVDDSVVQWLDKEFFKINDLKTAVLKANDTILWETARDNQSADLKLLGEIPPDKEIDSSKLSSLKNAFTWVRYQDIADPAAPPEEVGLDKARILTITDFNDFIYTLTITEPVGIKQFLKIQVAWQGALERPTDPEEKPEDREKAEAAFAQSVKTKQDQAKELNARLSPWLYEVEPRVVEHVCKTRADFLKDKPKPAETEKPAQD